jgi:hypothetical protein
MLDCASLLAVSYDYIGARARLNPCPTTGASKEIEGKQNMSWSISSRYSALGREVDGYRDHQVAAFDREAVAVSFHLCFTLPYGTAVMGRHAGVCPRD